MNESRQFISADEAQAPFFVGVDLGGQSIKIGVVDDRGRPLSWLSVPTEVELGCEAACQRMAGGIDRVLAEAGVDKSAVAYVGLGSPGTMDVPAGMLLLPVNLKGWEHFPIRDRLAHHCGKPVAFVNDGAAAAYGEFWVGAGQEMNSLVLLTLGTGIGCGIIVNGFSIDGENSHGAECGHIIVNPAPDARWCNCGQRGHLEAYSSATAVVRRTQEMLDAGLKTSIRPRVEAGEPLTPKLVAEEAEVGDPLAGQIVMDTAFWLGVGLVNLIHTIDPNGVLLGGAMTFGGKDTALGRRFLDRIKQEIDARAFALLAERLKLDLASLGADAGYIGAAGIARAEYLKKK
ncbi:MAG: ROK family protein [Planctomycetaceae bacterium]|nr:ROK family protein [Planctomycetaceae bacterium]